MALFSFELDSGREVHVTALYQSATYAGLLEGAPNAAMNARLLETATRSAGELFPSLPAILIPARARTLDSLPVHPRRGPVERLPVIKCVGRLESQGSARDPDADNSALVVVWYQDEPALPVAETALTALRALDWDQLAADGYF